MTTKFFPQTLPANTAKLIDQFHRQKPDFLKHFYLSGGTALSLQIGHRQSEDLDFFNQKPFRPGQLEKPLSTFGVLKQVQQAPGTLNAFLNNVKLQFLEYPYSLLKPFVNYQSIQLSSVLDIACTKLQTIASRGSKKDFIDLYFIFDNYPLPDLLKATQKKYPKIKYSQTHILKSLVYFQEAENQPMPRMLKKASWQAVKDKMIKAIKTVSLV